MKNNQTLAVKYRPASWEDLTEQEYIKTILENQIETNSIKNAYLFTRTCTAVEKLHLQEYLQIK